MEAVPPWEYMGKNCETKCLRPDTYIFTYTEGSGGSGGGTSGPYTTSQCCSKANHSHTHIGYTDFYCD